MINTPHFKRDAQFRAKLFDRRSFEHDAKANLYLVHWLLDTYTSPHQVILDPMAGTGTLFVGAAVGARRIHCGELESWLRPILANNRNRAGALALHPPGAYQADAANSPIANGSVDHLLFSPPYWDTFSDWNVSSNRLKDNHIGPHGSAYADERGQAHKRNAGNLHTYEDYLARMGPIYAECHRMLRPGGNLMLIVKDRIHAGLRIPIVTDTTTLLISHGFILEQMLTREAQLTQYRQLHRSKGMPTIDDEQVIIATKPLWQPEQPIHWAIVFPPDVDHGPPMQVHDWTLRLAATTADITLAFTPGPFIGPPSFSQPTHWRTRSDHLARARYTQRRQVTVLAAHELTAKHCLRAGDRVTLYLPWRYARYLQRRLTTLGADVDVPMKGRNMGQKMTWLKRAIADSSPQDQRP